MKTETKVALAAGGAAFAGSLVLTSSLRSLFTPKRGSAGALTIELSPLAPLIYLAFKEESTQTKAVRNGATIGYLAYELGNLYAKSARFETSVPAKAVQAVYSGVATFVGDQSLGPSAMFPAKVSGTDNLKDVADYIRDIIVQNDLVECEHIFKDLINNNLTVSIDAPNNVKFAVEKGISYNKAVEIMNAVLPSGLVNEFIDATSFDNLQSINSTVFDGVANEAARLALVKQAQTALRTFANLNTMWILINKDNQKLTYQDGRLEVGLAGRGSFDDYRKTLSIGARVLAAFLAEPHFKGQYYSGEDGASYSIPAPAASGAAPYEQLERAMLLSPEQKRFEGLADFMQDPVVVAPPEVARKLESTRAAQSLGRSRANPEQEVMVLSVEGANGIMRAPLEREVSVPQGSLISPPIRQASNVDVRTGGLFTRGLFTPNYSYRKGQA